MVVVIESSYAAGCDWCIEAILPTPHAHLAAELEISKAITYLRSKDFSRAAEILKMFEKKESRLLSTAAANLSFLYILVRTPPRTMHLLAVTPGKFVILLT
jgi:intraflagellar transport protein 88